MRKTDSLPDLDRLFTIKQVAELLHVHDRTVRRWVEARDLAAHRLGRQIRITQKDLEAFIKLRRLS